MGAVRVVLDTNVLISALGWGGKPERCLRLGLQGEVEMLASPATVAELIRVLEYPKFAFFEEEKSAFIAAILSRRRIVRPEVVVDEVHADPDDNAFLECALAGRADYLVTGDEALLAVGRYEGVTILTPDEFLSKRD